MLIRLDWDSSFFKMEVGKLELRRNSDLSSPGSSDFKLVYVFSDRKLIASELSSFEGTVHLVDEKRTYLKKISGNIESPSNVYSFLKGEYIPESLYQLAIQSGQFSRFLTDPIFPYSDFERLFKTWIEQSVARVNAKEVFVFGPSEQIKGFITLGIKSGRPDIGLVAVDADSRSLGIGKQLLDKAEYWAAVVSNKQEIQVVTQGANEGACRFYERNGYNLESVTYIYHWWKN